MTLGVATIKTRPVQVWQWTLLAVMGFMAAYFGLWSYPLLDNNEGLYAQIAREMALGGDWVIPHLNGVPYIEKPPLLYWLMALSYKVFGVHDWSARLIPSTFFSLEIALVSFAASRLAGRQVGWIVGMVCGSFWGMAVLSRMVFFDGILATLFASALLFTFLFWQEGRRAYLLIAAASLAGALLAKGFLAIALYGLITTLWCATLSLPWQGRLYYWLRLFDPWALVLFLVLSLPWHILASIQEPGFGWFYFINEHVLRFLDLRLPRDYYTGPWYFYIPRLLAYVFPWTFCLWTLWPRRDAQSFFSKDTRRFFWIWFLSTLVFFSLSRAKANYYMILGLPPMTFLIADGLIYLQNRAMRLLYIVIPTVIIVPNIMGFTLIKLLGACIDPKHPFISFVEVLSGKEGWRLLCLCITLLCLGALFFRCTVWSLKIQRDTVRTVTLQGLATICLCACIPVVGLYSEYFSQASAMHHARRTGLAVTLYRDYEALSSALFYGNTPIQVFESTSHDLAWGKAARPHAPQFVETIDPTAPPYLFLVRKQRRAEFESRFPDYTLLYHNPNTKNGGILYVAPTSRTTAQT